MNQETADLNRSSRKQAERERQPFQHLPALSVALVDVLPCSNRDLVLVQSWFPRFPSVRSADGFCVPGTASTEVCLCCWCSCRCRYLGLSHWCVGVLQCWHRHQPHRLFQKDAPARPAKARYSLASSLSQIYFELETTAFRMSCTISRAIPTIWRRSVLLQHCPSDAIGPLGLTSSGSVIFGCQGVPLVLCHDPQPSTVDCEESVVSTSGAPLRVHLPRLSCAGRHAQPCQSRSLVQSSDHGVWHGARRSPSRRRALRTLPTLHRKVFPLSR